MIGPIDRTQFTPISRDIRARGAIYLSVLASYAAAVQNDPLTPSMLLLFGLASFWSLGFEHRFLRPFFPAGLKIGLIVTGSFVFIAFFLGGLARPPESFANAIARFLFWNAIVFVLSRNKTEYDVWTLGIIDVSLFMISGAFVQPAAFLPLFLLALTCVLYAFQRLALLRCGPAGEQSRHGPGLVLTHVALVLEIGALLFFFFPRHIFHARPGARDASPKEEALAGKDPEPPESRNPVKTGLPMHSNELGLESLSKLKVDRATVLKMRIKTSSDNTRYVPGQPLYLRGSVYERYENGRWHANYEAETREADAEGWIATKADVASRDEVLQQIVRVTSGGEVVFALGEPVRLKWPRAKYDASGTFFLLDRPPDAAQEEYEVVSNFVSEAERDVRGLTPVPRARHLLLPEGLEQLRRKAIEVTARQRTPLDKAFALRQWLHHEGGFNYKLGPFQAPPGQDPIEHFLFGPRKEGYCMHFATALALMCRAAGIPARMVAGFHAEEYDWTRREYLVRHSDAHAWVEVPFPGHGWIRFDPTPTDTSGAGTAPENPPVATGEDQKRKEEEARKKKEAEAARRWDQFLVDYDPGAQSTALSSLFGGVARATGGVFRVLTSLAVLASIAALGVAGLLAYLLLPRDRKARLRQLLGGFRERSTVAFYRDFLWIAARKGVSKPGGLTGREFAAVARAKLPADAVSLLTEKFYEVKFGGHGLSAEDARRVREALRAIEAWMPQPAQPVGAGPNA